VFKGEIEAEGGERRNVGAEAYDELLLEVAELRF